MAVSVEKFWQLVAQSRLLSMERCDELAGHWSSIKGADSSDSARTLSEWLVSERLITRYQATVLLTGKTGPFLFDEYRVTDLVSQGRFAGCSRAVHIPTNHPVLLQFFSGPVAKDVSRWSKISSELLATASIGHPHLYPLYEAVIFQSDCFAVTEIVPGESLDRILRGGNVLPVEESCHLAMQAAVGVAHLHHHGIIHGEIRPANLWVDPHGCVKVLTGSLARDMARPAGYFDLAHADHDSRMKIAANYLAPERADRNAEPTHASDLYAIGCVLYEMLAGRPPFTSSTASEVIRQHAVENLPRISAQKIPSKLLRILSTMLAKEPALRFSSPDVAAVALKMLVSERPATRRTPPPATLAAFLEKRTNRLEQAKKGKGREEADGLPVSPAAGIPEKTGDAFSADGDRRQSGPPPSGTGSPKSKRTAQPPVISPADPRSETDALRTRLRAGHRNSVIAAIVFVAIAVAAVILFFVQFDPFISEGPNAPEPTSSVGSETDALDRSRARTEPTGSDAAVDPGGTRQRREIAMDDDGRSLWASPTSGPPIDLKYFPPGYQFFAMLRPATLLQHTEGEKILAGLGPWGEGATGDLQQLIGVPIERIDRLALGIANVGTTQELAVSYVVTLVEGVSAKELASGQGRAKTEDHGSQYFTEGRTAFLAPAEENDRLLIATPTRSIGQILEQGAAPPPMRRELERLLESTDADRHATLLVAPNFLFADGQAVLTGNAERLREPLFQFFGDGVHAAALSLHWGDDFFAELRLVGTLDEQPRKLAKSFKRQVDVASGKVEEYVLSFEREPYSRRLLARFPEMLRRLSNYTRSGIEEDQAVLRAYLPLAAGHNLLMATELLIAETPLAESTQQTAIAQQDGPPLGAEERLKKVTSVSFPRDTLEMALKMLAEDVGIEIVLLGGDLQLDGITKNQSFSLDERDKPASQILLAILRFANPDKTATGPADPKQKLIYVIKSPSPGKEEVVLVTTRAQAEKRGDTIPKVFRAEE